MNNTNMVNEKPLNHNLTIPLASPDITDLERRYVLEVLETPCLSIGPKVQEFEKKLAEYAGVNHAVAVNSGTSALHLIVRSLGIGEGDEVITTPFSFVSSSNCLLFERAKPVFVDIDPDSLNIDTDLIEEAITPRTRAILAVDVFGYPARWDKLEEISKKHGLHLIEDSAESIGSRYSGRMCGSFGDAAIFAFYPNKQITTGEGGAVLTNSKTVADLCRGLRNQGRDVNDQWLQHSYLGYNYRISEINCALGIAQLQRIEEIVAARARVARTYNERLASVKEVIPPKVNTENTNNVRISHFVYVIRLSDNYSQEDRDQILEKLREKGIGCSNYFAPIHIQPFYKKLGFNEGDYPITESVAARTIALPFFNNLSEKQIDYVVEQLRDML